jgi:phospholipase/lecithinase/hemolysin
MELKRHLPRLGLALALFFSPFTPAPVLARVSALSNLFVFGDSLSDSGNSKAISNVATFDTFTFPPSPYFGGRFSNGLVAAEYLWQAFNPGDSSFRASLLPGGGTNYAVGGATTGVENFVEVWDVTPDFLKSAYAGKGNAWQLTQFTTPIPPSFDPETSLFLIWLYPNDPFYLGASGGQGVGTFEGNSSSAGIVLPTAVDNIIGTIKELSTYGATNFLVPNSPDLGLIPEYINDPILSPFFTSLSYDFNMALSTALSEMAANHPELYIEPFRINDLFTEVIGNPGSFGFTDTSSRCIAVVTCVGGSAAAQSTFLFWDGSHPTTAGHALIGQRFYQAVYEPVPGPLSVAGGAVALGWSRRLRRRLRLRSRRTSRSCEGRCRAG